MSPQSTDFWKKPGLWVALGVLVLVGAGSTLVVRQQIAARQRVEDQAALPPPRQVKVVALGRIEPASPVVQVSASEAGRIDQLLVARGDPVEAGQILAYLDRYGVRRAERDLAASQLAEALAQLAAQRNLGQAQIQEAATRLGQVDDPQRSAIAAQAAAIQSLQAQLNVAEIDLARFQQLHRSGAIARQELDRQQATVNQLRADVANAKATEQRLAQTRSTDMTQAAAQLAAVQANTALAQLQSRVDSATQTLALAEAQLALTVVRSPQVGQVLDVIAYPGEAVAPGGNPIVSLGDTRQMYVVSEVYETDIGRVQLGQSATITSRNGAFPGSLTGTVAEIGLQIAKNDVIDDDPAANADARVVEVRVRIDQSDVVAALTNLQVDVEIDIESVANSAQ